MRKRLYFSATAGDSVTLTGSNFGVALDATDVELGGVPCNVSYVTDTSMVCTLGEREGGVADVLVRKIKKHLEK